MIQYRVKWCHVTFCRFHTLYEANTTTPACIFKTNVMKNHELGCSLVNLMVKFWALLIIYQLDCSLFQNKECLARTRLASERNTRIWVTLDERWYCWEGCQESHSSPEIYILWQNCLPTHRSSNYCAACSVILRSIRVANALVLQN